MRDAAHADWIAEARAVPIVQALGGRGAKLRREGAELVGPCPVCGGIDRFAVNARKGVFLCRRSGEGGDVIDLTRYLEACNFTVACEILTGRPAPGRSAAESAEDRAARDAVLAKRAAARARDTEASLRTEQRFRERERSWCWQTWIAGAAITGTPAEAYLRRRGLVMPHRAALRYLPDHPLYASGGPRAAIVHSGPAMIAAIVGPAGRFAALHTTWIDLAAADGKARVADPKTGELVPARKVRGSAGGGHIPIVDRRDATDLVLGEGIETVGSVWRAHEAHRWAHQGAAAYWAAYSLDNIGGPATGSVPHPSEVLRDARGRERARPVKGPVPDLSRPGIILPPSVRRVWLLGDGDSDRFATETALRRGGARFRAARPDLDVLVAWAPDGMDFNDVLRSAAA